MFRLIFLLLLLTSAEAFGNHYNLFFGRGRPLTRDCSSEVMFSLLAQATWEEENSIYGTCVVSACQENFFLQANQCYPANANPAQIAFTVPGVYLFEVPSNVHRILIAAAGGGGSGGGSTTANGGGGGGGGGAHYSREFLNVVPGEIYTVQVGAGGEGVIGPVTGQDGSDSSWYLLGNPIFTWAGGFGGSPGGSSGTPGVGGSVNGAGGSGGAGGGAGASGLAGQVGSSSVFLGVVPGNPSLPYLGIAGGGGGGGASLGSGGNGVRVDNAASGSPGSCGGGGGGTSGNVGGATPWSYEGGDGCVFIFY